MNRKNKYWLISFSLLLIIDVVLLVKRTNEVVSKIDSGSPVEGTNDSYQSSFIDLLENDGLPIQDMGILDMADNSVKALSELFADDSVLFVCRVSQFQCQDCASYALEKAIELVENDSTGMKLLFFCEYEYRSLKIFVDEHPRTKSYGVYQASFIDLPIESRTYPYYFTLSKDMVVHDVFAPNTVSSVKTGIYWNFLSKKWG
jgi:hypothetical protein